jgi:hypothetical protein
MRTIAEFIKTTLIGGLLIVLPPARLTAHEI